MNLTRKDWTRTARGSGRPNVLTHLYSAVLGVQERLQTAEGRARLAANYREQYGFYHDRCGYEIPLFLLAADAIERADWPALGRLMRREERERWNQKRAEHAEDREDHRGVLALARQLEQEGKQ